MNSPALDKPCKNIISITPFIPVSVPRNILEIKNLM
jgi:hypothetical protein